MMSLTPADKEILRKALLRFLAERFRLSFAVGTIVTMMRARGYVDFQIYADCIEEAVKVLSGKDLVDGTQDQFGSTWYYRITGEGIVENERVNL